MTQISDPQSGTGTPGVVQRPSAPGREAVFARFVRSGWLPGGLAVGLTIAWLAFYSVPVQATVAFTAYLSLGITLPGLLLWRFTNRGPGVFAADLAAGAAVGYVMEVMAYILGRAIGLPWLALVPQALTITTFLVFPNLRRYWRGAGAAARTPALWSWGIVAVWLVLLYWSARFASYHGLTWPGYGSPDHDMPFHLALVGEAKHHMPMKAPWVIGEPLLYHWFVYAEVASTSWITGIEPLVLLTRLSPLPWLGGFVVLIAMVARRLTGNWWSGVVATVITLFVLAPYPYGWNISRDATTFGFSPYEDGSMFRLVLWTSPTQTFATMLFVPVVLLIIDLLGSHARDRRRWALLALLITGVMGAKATYLPLLLAGLFLVAVVQFVIRRQVPKSAMLAAAITLLCLIFAQVVLFGGTGASQGLMIQPLDSVRTSAAMITTGFTNNPRWWRLLLMTGVMLFCWVCVWGSVVALRRRLVEPPILLLLGVGLAGMGAVLVFGQPGGSQGFFLQSARPYLAVAATCGLTVLIPRMTRRIALALTGAALFGLVVLRIIRVLSGKRVPLLGPGGGPKTVAFSLTWPYALLFIGALGFGLLVWRKRSTISSGLALALVFSMLAGSGLYGGYVRLSMLTREGLTTGFRNVAQSTTFVSQGTLEAGRWLRDHSQPDDLVATNAHCLLPIEPPNCYNIHFSVAAYSERRILLEGWGFTPSAHLEAERDHADVSYVPYWNPDLRYDNDMAFYLPSAKTVGKLRDKYHVRWLFVDETQGKPPARLALFATFRFRSGPSVVYELNK